MKWSPFRGGVHALGAVVRSRWNRWRLIGRRDSTKGSCSCGRAISNRDYQAAGHSYCFCGSALKQRGEFAGRWCNHALRSRHQSGGFLSSSPSSLCTVLAGLRSRRQPGPPLWSHEAPRQFPSNQILCDARQTWFDSHEKDCDQVSPNSDW